MNEPVRTPESWPMDFKSARAVPDGVEQLDVSSDAAWWVAGLAVGAAFLLVMALIDAREEVRNQAVQIRVLKTKLLQQHARDAEWTCSRLTDKRGVLGKWCIRSEGK